MNKPGNYIVFIYILGFAIGEMGRCAAKGTVPVVAAPAAPVAPLVPVLPNAEGPSDMLAPTLTAPPTGFGPDPAHPAPVGDEPVPVAAPSTNTARPATTTPGGAVDPAAEPTNATTSQLTLCEMHYDSENSTDNKKRQQYSNYFKQASKALTTNQVTHKKMGGKPINQSLRLQSAFLSNFVKNVTDLCQAEERSGAILGASQAQELPTDPKDCAGFSTLDRSNTNAQTITATLRERAKELLAQTKKDFSEGWKINHIAVNDYKPKFGGNGDPINFPGLAKEFTNIWGQSPTNQQKDSLFGNHILLLQAQIDQMQSTATELSERQSYAAEKIANCKKLDAANQAVEGKSSFDKTPSGPGHVLGSTVSDASAAADDQRKENPAPVVAQQDSMNPFAGMSAGSIGGAALAGGILVGGGYLIYKSVKNSPDPNPQYYPLVPGPAPNPYPTTIPGYSPGYYPPGYYAPAGTVGYPAGYQYNSTGVLYANATTASPPAGSNLAVSPSQPPSAKAYLNISTLTVNIIVPGGGLSAATGVPISVSCTQPNPCPLSGTTTAQTQNGSAAFSGLMFTSSVTGAVLTFTSTGLANTSTATFNVSP